MTLERYNDPAVADSYDAKRSSHPVWAAEESVLAEWLQGFEGALLDIPVGTGRFLHIYQTLRLNGLKGLDISEAMMAHARARGWGDAYLAWGNIFDLRLPRDTYDVAVCMRLLTHLSAADTSRALSRLLDVAPRAIVSINVGDPPAIPLRRIFKSWQEWRGMTARLEIANAAQLSPTYWMFDIRRGGQ